MRPLDTALEQEIRKLSSKGNLSKQDRDELARLKDEVSYINKAKSECEHDSHHLEWSERKADLFHSILRRRISSRTSQICLSRTSNRSVGHASFRRACRTVWQERKVETSGEEYLFRSRIQSFRCPSTWNALSREA